MVSVVEFYPPFTCGICKQTRGGKACGGFYKLPQHAACPNLPRWVNPQSLTEKKHVEQFEKLLSIPQCDERDQEIHEFLLDYNKDTHGTTEETWQIAAASREAAAAAAAAE